MNHQTNATYQGDFYAWLHKSAELLRRGQFSDLDLEQIAEELEGMARSDKRQLINRCAVLLAHLLKWQYQPEPRSKIGQFDRQSRQVTQDLALYRVPADLNDLLRILVRILEP